MIEGRVNGQHLELSFDVVVSDSVKYLTIKFICDDSWNGAKRKAVFTLGKDSYAVVLDKDNPECTDENTCIVPFEVIHTPGFTVGLVGTEGDKVITTLPCFVPVLKSGELDGAEPKDPTPDQYAQIIDICAAAQQVAASVRADADNGLFKGEKGDKGDKGDTGAAFTYDMFTDGQLEFLRGPQGEKGDKGDMGPQGEKGEKGDTGAQGIKGDQGPEGKQGQRGPVGPQGEKGEKGDKGEQGIQGVQGIQGEKGDKGDKGEKGDKGDKGDTGEVTVQYANTTFSNALIGKKSGGTVVLDDISPLEHTLKIKATGTDSVIKCGKNLIQYPYYDGHNVKGGITYTMLHDGGVNANGTANANATYYFAREFSLPMGQYTLSISGNCVITGDPFFYIYDATDKKILAAINVTDDSQKSFTLDTSYDNLNIYIYCDDASYFNGNIYPQLELGETATEYEQYIEPIVYPVNEDGTVEGVTSMYPTTVLTTDTEGATIEAEYNKDINKAFCELQNAIINLGGTI